MSCGGATMPFGIVFWLKRTSCVEEAGAVAACKLIVKARTAKTGKSIQWF